MAVTEAVGTTTSYSPSTPRGGTGVPDRTPSEPGPAWGNGPTVAEVMIRRPKVLPADASLGDVRAVFEDDHVVMVLLTEDDALRGTLIREDLAPDTTGSTTALAVSRLSGRTVAPAERAAAVEQRLLDHGERRLAVVDDDGILLGLMCLKRRRDGFCSDAGVDARARAGRGATTSPGPASN